MNAFLNQAAFRIQFSRREREIAANRIHENPTTYQRALRDSIEYTLLQTVENETLKLAAEPEEVAKTVPVAA